MVANVIKTLTLDRDCSSLIRSAIQAQSEALKVNAKLKRETETERGDDDDEERMKHAITRFTAWLQ